MLNRSMLENVLCSWSIRVKKTKIFLREATVMEKSNELLKWHSCFNVWLHQYFVSHEECSHHLKNWDFKGEVEWSDHCHWSIRPSIASSKLTIMVTW